jgi:mannosyl-oligosaccharide glucosidase
MLNYFYREVILGEEAQAKVPQEYWIQNNEYANPPALFLPLLEFVRKVNATIGSSKTQESDLEFLTKVYPRLKKWYSWFNITQIGKSPFTYRWRGRNPDSPTELNAKTLTSGLDDYPRASHPTDKERHLDLRCWIALASNVMAKIAELTNNFDDKKAYYEHYLTLSDNNLLNSLHWSGSQYADYGLHSDNIRLVRPQPRQDMNRPPQPKQMIRKVETEPTYGYINSVGYVSLFPFLLEIVDPDSQKLDVILDQIKNPALLWTKYGLRSLAQNAPLYARRNTEHDPPYWRGAIWINMNYLALKALKHYSIVEGPFKEKAAAIHNELRDAVINNILENYSKTGYIWEQYNDVTGKGQGSHPFTGWSSLYVLMMSEVY